MSLTTQGWYPGIKHAPTAAYGYPTMAAGTMKPIAIVSHIMQGYQTTMLRWADQRPPTNYVSAHFTINRDGHVVQHVGIFDPAWASGGTHNPTWPLYRETPTERNANYYTVAIEHEGFAIEPRYSYDFVYDEDEHWPEAMVEASIKVQQWICVTAGITPNESTVIGHNSINTAKPNCPGSMWPRHRIITALQNDVVWRDHITDELNFIEESAKGVLGSVDAVRSSLTEIGESS